MHLYVPDFLSKPELSYRGRRGFSKVILLKLISSAVDQINSIIDVICYISMAK